MGVYTGADQPLTLMFMTKRGTVTLRARAETRDALNTLAAGSGQSVPELLDELAARERDRRLLHEGIETLANLPRRQLAPTSASCVSGRRRR